MADDWSSGELADFWQQLQRHKGRDDTTFQAIAAQLQRVRPWTSVRDLFLRHQNILNLGVSAEIFIASAIDANQLVSPRMASPPPVVDVPSLLVRPEPVSRSRSKREREGDSVEGEEDSVVRSLLDLSGDLGPEPAFPRTRPMPRVRAESEHSERLASLLTRQPLLARWVWCEWFTAEVDRQWQQHADFAALLRHLGLPRPQPAPRLQWLWVRSRMYHQHDTAAPRRLSPLFLRQERQRLHSERDALRQQRLRLPGERSRLHNAEAAPPGTQVLVSLPNLRLGVPGVVTGAWDAHTHCYVVAVDEQARRWVATPEVIVPDTELMVIDLAWLQALRKRGLYMPPLPAPTPPPAPPAPHEAVAHVTELYVLLSQKEQLQSELVRLNQAAHALLEEGSTGGPLASLQSKDFHGYYCWVVLALDKLNVRVADALRTVKHWMRPGSSPVDSHGVPEEVEGAEGHATRWYADLLEECSAESARQLAEAQAAVGRSGGDTVAAKALKLVAVLGKAVALGFDEAEIRVALDAALTALRPEHAQNMAAFRALMAQGRQLQALYLAGRHESS